jgi:hypothetical protein
VRWSVALKRIVADIGARVEQRGDLLVVAKACSSRAWRRGRAP